MPAWLYDLLRFAWFTAGVIGLAKLIEWGWELWGDRLERWWRAVTRSSN
jgi:hypothetical protein